MDNPVNVEKKSRLALTSHCFSLAALHSAGVKRDTSTGTTAVFFQGHTHKANLHHQLRPWKGSLGYF